MKSTLKIISYCFILILLNFQAYSQKVFQGANGSWKTPTNWNPSGVPTINDDVNIPDDFTVNIDTNANCKSLTIGSSSGGNKVATINFSNSSNSIVIANGIIFNTISSNGNLKINALNINSSSVNCGSITMAENSGDEISVINITTGSLTVRGNITMNSVNNLNQINITGAGRINIKGNFNSNGTFSPGTTSTIAYNGVSNQTIRSATYANLIIDSTLNKTMAGDVIVNSTLSLTSGNLVINGNRLTLNGAVNRSAGFISGSNTSSLTIAGSAANASLFFDQTNSTTNSLSNLVNTRNNGITVSNTLNIIDSINVSNGTINSNGNITLISTSTKTARVARIISGGISGNITAQRYIPGGVGKRRWRFLSSPVNVSGSISLTDYIDDIHVTGMGGSTNGFDNCNCLPSIRFYNETINAIADSGWRNPSTINYTVNTGFAVEVFVRGSRNTPDPFVGTSTPDNATIDYTGTLNSGAININLSYTNNAKPTSDGFNLVGNPYASQIDWMASGWTKTNIDRYFWSYDPRSTTPVYGVFDPNSGLGTNGVTRYIPSGIGFFVKANNTGAQLGFTESIKANNTPYNFFKNNNTSSSLFPFLRFNAGDSLMNDEAIIIFDSTASANALDPSDVMKLFNPNINFYSKSKENKNLAINQIAFPNNSKEDTINFSMFVFKDTAIRVGQYNLSLTEMVDIPAWLGIDILDRYSNTRTDIKNNSYDFNIENKTGSHGNNRLAIILYRKTTGIDNQNKLFSIHPNPAQNIIKISNNNIDIEKIQIFNINSQLIKEFNSNLNSENEINITELTNGLYFMHIQSNRGTEVHKIIIKH